MKTPEQREKKVKAWAVKWTKGANESYGGKGDLICEDSGEYKIKAGKYYISMFTIFSTRKQAEAWREKNPDFEVVPCLIIINPKNK